MKTLVIHPLDHSTDFLSAIYARKDWTILTDPSTTQDALIKLINDYDRVIMMGHGSPQGLFGGKGLIINEEIVTTLREKETVFIWCHADKFVNKYKLKGFFTGMFVSEEDEALYCGIMDSTVSLIKRSNKLFAQTVNCFIDTDHILENVKALYHNKTNTNPVIEYNYNRLYFNS